MKRVIIYMLTLVCLLSLVSCTGSTTIKSGDIHDDISQYAISLASYPKMAKYPNEMSYIDEETGILDNEGFFEVYEAWHNDKMAQLDQPEGYSNGMNGFIETSIRQFLSKSNGQNLVYSPLNVYMALAMLAEVTDGNSREQILELLGSESIDLLRTQARSVWNANYLDDGAVTSVLANSLWLNDDVRYIKRTMDTLTDYYYASSFSGKMGSDELNKALQSWINGQTMDFLHKGDAWDKSKFLIVNMSLPKFDLASNIDLSLGLQELGVTDIFDNIQSDFSPMTADVDGIYLSSSEHAARVAIDEEGVTAAAYTVRRRG